jgi:inorganic pyrophosphatase
MGTLVSFALRPAVVWRLAVGSRKAYHARLAVRMCTIRRPAMNLDAIPVGPNPPWDLNVVIEIPQGGLPVKYEMDKASGALFVDRFLHTAMYYPGNYGFVPHTLADDGDPCDVIVLNPTPVVPGCVIRSRPIGVLMMEDEAGGDDKILAVPVDALHPYYTDIASYRQLPTIMVEQIEHFFTRYKDLEKNKSVRVKRWGDAGEAAELISQGVRAHLEAEKAGKKAANAA